MTLSEFKAWLDGMSDGIADAPTPEQWAKVKEKLADVREALVPMPVLSPPPPFDWRKYEPYCGTPVTVRVLPYTIN